MKKLLLIITTIICLAATSVEARGPSAYNRGRHYNRPSRQVVVVNNYSHQPRYYRGHHHGYNNSYYYRSSHHYDRDAARAGAVILGVGALALAVSSF